MTRDTQHQQDADLDSFEAMDNAYDGSDEIEGARPEPIADDADFQDVHDEADADVFGEEQPADEPARKKGISWFNVAVAVVAVAVAGGLIWLKLAPSLTGGNAGGSDLPALVAQGPATPAQGAGSPDESAQQALKPVTEAVSPGGGLLNNPDQLAALSQNTPAPSAPQTQPQADPFAGLSQQPLPQQAAAPVTQNAPAPSIPMPAPISGAPAGDIVAQPITPAKIQTSQPAAEIAAPADPTLKAHVDALEQKLDALDTKVSAAIDKMSQPAPSAAPVDDDRLNAIQSSLTRLESRIDDLASSRAKAAPVTASDEAGPTPAPRKTSPARAKVKAKTASAPPSSSQWDQPYTPVPEGAARPSSRAAGSSASGGWELRGARTGFAVLAKGDDMREVAVGDVVPGLGQVTGIATIGGRWVVQGTQGRIGQ